MASSNSTQDVVIIGGGIIGCSLAEALAREGLSVTLLERGLIGREASWAAAGMLAPQSETDEPGPHFDFCLSARRLYPAEARRLRDLSGIDPQYRGEGMFFIACDEETERTIRRRAAWQQAMGLGADLLTPEQVLRAEPAVTPDLRTGVHFREDHQIDSRLMTRAYAVAARQAGARLLEYCPVLELIRENGRVAGVELPRQKIHARWVIVAGGCWSGLLAGLTAPLPTYPVKGQMLLLQSSSPLFDHTLHGPSIYLVPRLDGRIVVGATEEHDAGFDKSVEAGAVSDLLDRAYALAPKLRAATMVDMWAGLRPGTPDRRPILGPCEIEGLLLATGHFRNGILLAPITARSITELILTGKTPEDIKLYSPERFSHESKPPELVQP